MFSKVFFVPLRSFRQSIGPRLSTDPRCAFQQAPALLVSPLTTASRRRLVSSGSLAAGIWACSDVLVTTFNTTHVVNSTPDLSVQIMGAQVALRTIKEYLKTRTKERDNQNKGKFNR